MRSVFGMFILLLLRFHVGTVSPCRQSTCRKLTLMLPRMRDGISNLHVFVRNVNQVYANSNDFAIAAAPTTTPSAASSTATSSVTGASANSTAPTAPTLS